MVSLNCLIYERSPCANAYGFWDDEGYASCYCRERGCACKYASRLGFFKRLFGAKEDILDERGMRGCSDFVER